MGLPWCVTFALQDDGWLLRSKITWIKKAPMPESVGNRPSNATEELFLFARNPSYSYDNQAVREESGTNLRNHWILGPDSSGVPHPAVLLKELVRRCIFLGSQPGDVILDPLSGSGTSGVVAAQPSRKASLVELNPVYAQQSRARINQDLQLTMIP